jgi:hypothetical protein
MKALQPKVANFRLATLVAHFGLPETTGYHRAMSDSLHVMGLFLRFLDEVGPLPLETILEIGGVPSLYDVRSGRLNGHARIAHLSAVIERADVIVMRYDGGTRGPGGRRILPLNISSSGGSDYLIAQCMDDGAVKEFRLDRIIEILPVNHAESWRTV